MKKPTLPKFSFLLIIINSYLNLSRQSSPSPHSQILSLMINRMWWIKSHYISIKKYWLGLRISRQAFCKHSGSLFLLLAWLSIEIYLSSKFGLLHLRYYPSQKQPLLLWSHSPTQYSTVIWVLPCILDSWFFLSWHLSDLSD